MQLGTEGAPESLHAMQLLAPVLVHDCFLQQRISQRTFDAIQSLFPDLLFFGVVLFVSVGNFVVSGNVAVPGPLQLILAPGDVSNKEHAASHRHPTYAALPSGGTLLCAPIRLLGSVYKPGTPQLCSKAVASTTGAMGMLLIVMPSSVLHPDKYMQSLHTLSQILSPHLMRTDIIRRTTTLVQRVASTTPHTNGHHNHSNNDNTNNKSNPHSNEHRGSDQPLATNNGGECTMVSGVLDQRLAGVITHMVQQLSEERAQSKSRGGDGGDGGWRDDASDGGSSSTGRISSHMPGMMLVRENSNGTFTTTTTIPDTTTHHLTTPHPHHHATTTAATIPTHDHTNTPASSTSSWTLGTCAHPVPPPTMQLLTQVLQQSVIQTHSPPGSVSDVSSSRGGVVAHAHQAYETNREWESCMDRTAPTTTGIEKPVLNVERWFDHHWFWLRFRDVELEKRYTWWHSRQCVRMDSVACWALFVVVVALLTVEPFSLANYHPNAFALAFLIVPGVYILHRWDTDWYVKRRHAVLVVLTTYYLVYNVIFIAPVLLLVMPPHTLRRPLWVFRMCGVDYMLLQLWYQLPFEKQFWLGILHLGIASSLQQGLCSHVWPQDPPPQCHARITALQLLVGYVATLAIGWRWERTRRKGFLKYVRAERPDGGAAQRPIRGSRSGARRG